MPKSISLFFSFDGLAAAARCGAPPLLLETADGVLGRTDTAGDRSRMARPGNACPRNFFEGVCRLHTGHTTDGHTQCGEAWHLK